MLQRLKGGYIDVGCTAFTGGASDKYKPVLQSIGPGLATAVDQLGVPTNAAFASNLVEIMLVRTDAGGVKTGYRVALIRQEDGIWRIDGM